MEANDETGTTTGRKSQALSGDARSSSDIGKGISALLRRSAPLISVENPGLHQCAAVQNAKIASPQQILLPRK